MTYHITGPELAWLLDHRAPLAPVTAQTATRTGPDGTWHQEDVCPNLPKGSPRMTVARMALQDRRYTPCPVCMDPDHPLVKLASATQDLHDVLSGAANAATVARRRILTARATARALKDLARARCTLLEMAATPPGIIRGMRTLAYQDWERATLPELEETVHEARIALARRRRQPNTPGWVLLASTGASHVPAFGCRHASGITEAIATADLLVQVGGTWRVPLLMVIPGRAPAWATGMVGQGDATYLGPQLPTDTATTWSTFAALADLAVQDPRAALDAARTISE